MTRFSTKEAPARPPSKPGASKNREGFGEHSPHTSSISRTTRDSNPQPYDPIVEAIRILARRGRQLREAEEAAEIAQRGAAAPATDAAENTTPIGSTPEARSDQNKTEVSHG